jgi:hypothetical protein
LSSKGPATDHFEGFEPTFDPNDPSATVIWTRKEALRNSEGAVSGLIGYVVDGYPVQMRKMTDFFLGRLPFYASMKDINGNIVWANEEHLKMMSERLDEIIGDDDSIEPERKVELLKKNTPVSAKLHAINGNKGPTDEQLYADGQSYRRKDEDIMDLAREYADKPLDDFYTRMETLIAKWQVEAPEDGYPKSGWMEHHCFPKSDTPKWVEVWKLPWWEERVEAGKVLREVKGVLVFFIDNHKTYLRKSVVWRWIERHLKLANDATTVMLEEKTKKFRNVDEVARMLIRLRLPKLIRRMLRRMKSFVDDKPGSFTASPCEVRQMNELESLLSIVEHCFKPKIPVKYEGSSVQELKLERLGDDLFGIVVAIVINAIEATQHAFPDQDVHSVSVVARTEGTMNDVLVIQVTNDGESPTEADVVRINRLDGLNRKDKRPGGGFFVAKRLANYLASTYAKDALPQDFNCEHLLELRARPAPENGAQVTIRLPMAVFRIDGTQDVTQCEVVTT